MIPMTADEFPPPMTAGQLIEKLSKFEPDTPVGVQIDPWAPVGRTVEKITATNRGVIFHMGPTNPRFN